jgi:ElaB/YqjD/DUF883 family membrane-anchored ribosome-binding protein
MLKDNILQGSLLGLLLPIHIEFLQTAEYRHHISNTGTANQTGERIAAARAKAEESLKAAKARLAEEKAALMAKTRAAAKATEDYVRANPWKTVGIAAGAGFVLCILATRLGQSVIEAGERVIIKGSRAIQGAEKEVQKLLK